MIKKEKATQQTRTYPSTQKRLERMARQQDVKVPEIIDRLSKTGDPSDPKKIKETPVSQNLKLVSKSTVVKTTEIIDPGAYFNTRTGLYVWDNFRERVLPGVGVTKKGNSFKLTNYDLVQGSSDEAIEASLPKKHLFSNSDVCAIVATLIDSQKNGEPGPMITTGYTNLFYTDQCVVYVRWSAGDRGWHVDAWRRGDVRWLAGRRVFSPAN